MVTKFTKGPWEWVVDRNTGGFYGLYAGDHPVVYPQRCNEGDEGLAWFSTDESYYGETALTEANAALIACAPEMYEMLEVASKQLSHSPIGYRINKLLAKARGEA